MRVQQYQLHAKARRSSGSSDNYHLGPYGGAQWGDIALRTGSAYNGQFGSGLTEQSFKANCNVRF